MPEALGTEEPMLQDNPRNVNILGFALGAAVGLCAAIVMPDEWSNLAYTPWFAGWVLLPSLFVYAALCIVTFTDFVSNDGANLHWLATLWMLSVALTMGVYGLGLSVLAMRVTRLWMQGDRAGRA
jgi:hypothetical protein